MTAKSRSTRQISREEWELLRYPIQLQELSELDGGGWMAWIPLLGEAAFMVDAETAAEAIEELEKLRLARYDMVTSSNQAIPLPPEKSEVEMPRGEWLVRATPLLQLRLQEAAERRGVSLNRYCVEALENNLEHSIGAEQAQRDASSSADELIRWMRQAIEAVKALPHIEVSDARPEPLQEGLKTA